MSPALAQNSQGEISLAERYQLEGRRWIRCQGLDSWQQVHWVLRYLQQPIKKAKEWCVWCSDCCCSLWFRDGRHSLLPSFFFMPTSCSNTPSGWSYTSCQQAFEEVEEFSKDTDNDVVRPGHFCGLFCTLVVTGSVVAHPLSSVSLQSMAVQARPAPVTATL